MALTLRVEYLMGQCDATALDDPREAEWPPHPWRVFSALVASYYRGEGDSDELELLREIESTDPPAIGCGAATQFKNGITFVPVADAQYLIRKKKKSPYMPGTKLPRFRAAARFPSCVPDDPVVEFHWSEMGERHRGPLKRMAGRLWYLGRSSSLVSFQVVDEPRALRYRPTDSEGPLSLRVPYRGALADLDATYEATRASRAAGIRRYLARPRTQHYTDQPPGVTVAQGEFGDAITFARVDGPNMPLERGMAVASATRRAILKLAGPGCGELISGHGDDGSQSRRSHLGFLPLANVGWPRSDGDIKGIAVVLPHPCSSRDRRRVLEVVSTLNRIEITPGAVWKIQRQPIPTLRSMQMGRYNRSARRWATVTPVVLHRYPRKQSPEEIVADACEHIGLPRPLTVSVAGYSQMNGSPPAMATRLVTQSGRPGRYRTHAVIEWDDPVRGPVVIGAYRYQGMGVCLPCER